MMDEREVLALSEQLEAMGALIGLPVDPAYRLDVAWYVAELLEAAELVAGFPLDDTVEPASIFHP